MRSQASEKPGGKLGNLLPWLVGAAILGAVIAIVLHYSEGKAFIEMAQRARPTWLLVAALLQLATYATEGGIWGLISRRAGRPLGLGKSAEISFAKLFVDQSVPSGGVSGSLLVASALKRQDLDSKVIGAAVALERASFHAAYALALVVAVVIGLTQGRVNSIVLAWSALFVLSAAGVTIGIVALAGSRWRPGRRLGKIKPIRDLVAFVRDADPALVRSPAMLMTTIGLQVVIIALDVATMVVIIRSVGAKVPASGVFVSFMVSSLFRTFGFVPGGLGTFEASSILTLRMAGASFPVALSATLLFRGLTYWLPMLPGLLFARQAMKHEPAGQR